METEHMNTWPPIRIIAEGLTALRDVVINVPVEIGEGTRSGDILGYRAYCVLVILVVAVIAAVSMVAIVALQWSNGQSPETEARAIGLIDVYSDSSPLPIDVVSTETHDTTGEDALCLQLGESSFDKGELEIRGYVGVKEGAECKRGLQRVPSQDLEVAVKISKGDERFRTGFSGIDANDKSWRVRFEDVPPGRDQQLKVEATLVRAAPSPG